MSRTISADTANDVFDLDLDLHPGSDAAAHWKFQTVEGDAIHLGNPTDARGLRLRAESGYGWVDMGDGWLQLSVAIRKVALAEQMAALAVVQS